MTTVFEPGAINGMIVKNRFVCSAIWNGMAEKDGACSQKMIDLVALPARGNVGLVITGGAFVSSDGHAYPGQAGIHNDALLSGLTAMTQAVHEAGGRIVAQLYHAGVFADPKLTGQDPLGPSVLNTDNGALGKEMTIEQIRSVVLAFGEAAARAKKAGFDGVQIHGAHGYLVGQFLSPFFNHRAGCVWWEHREPGPDAAGGCAGNQGSCGRRVPRPGQDQRGRLPPWRFQHR